MGPMASAYQAHPTMCSADLLPPSPPAEKATARQDQAGQTGYAKLRPPQSKSVLVVKSPARSTRRQYWWEDLGHELTTASRQGEKNTASCD
jgi:hypothetical protein